MIGDDLLLFGGLYSDYDEDTVTRGRQPTLLKLLKLLTPLLICLLYTWQVYIMKDFLRMGVGQLGGPDLARLAWGPSWRFDHTMIIASEVQR